MENTKRKNRDAPFFVICEWSRIPETICGDIPDFDCGKCSAPLQNAAPRLNFLHERYTKMEMQIYVFVSEIPHLAVKYSELKRSVHARLTFVLFLVAMILAGPVLADDQLPPPGLMQPANLAISLPVSGFTWLPGQPFRGGCGEISNNEWIRKVSGNVAMFLHADGPYGSGRYWNVKIGVGSNENSEPNRGVCLTTSTVGWRTLQRFKGGGLPWLDDLNGDGRAELIIWDSFALREDASMAEFAMVAWAYRLVSHNLLAIDWKLSRSLARSIAAEYRTTPDIKDPSLVQLRSKAAEALERFADEQCSARQFEGR